MTSPKGAVSSTKEGALGILTMSDGTGANRLDGAFLSQLKGQLDSLLDDSSVKAILLRSAEEAFCLGMNLELLKESLKQPGQEEATRADSVAGYGRLLERIALGPKPVIALVEGAVKAGGMGLVAACDIVLADSEGSSFELSEVLFGLIPANVLPFLMKQRISPQQARYLVLSAKRLDAGLAKDLGIVDEVYAPEYLERGLRDLVKNIMRAEPGALAASKSFIAANLDMPFKDFRRAAEAELLSLMKRPEVEAGLAAFAEGRSPDWFERFKPSRPLSAAWKSAGERTGE